MDDLRALAETQHGVVARRQCRSLGIGADALKRHLRAGEWEVVSPRVLRRRGAPWSPEARTMAGVLDAGSGAAASHSTAAALWRLPGFHLAPVAVSIRRGDDGRGARLGRVHRPRSLPAHHVTTVNGIAVTTPARTIFDLAGVLAPHRTERALDNALAKSPGLLRVMHRMLPELAERGRTGIVLMRELLAARPAGYIPPASGLESRVIRLMHEAGIPTRRQVDLGGDDWIGRVDLVVTGSNLVIEVDSVRFHSSLLDRERDARRDAELGALGYAVLRVTEEEVWSAPADVTCRGRRALSRSGTEITTPAA